MISIIKYEHNNLINEKLSKICNKRVIWGGDRTISELRSYKIPPKSIDITFPDRYSFCIINSEEICKLKNNELKRLVHNFYNDTYLVDQNACSSPNLVFWIGRYYKKARGIFWSELYNYLKKNYKMEDIVALDKYTKLLDNILLNNNFLDYQNFDNLIYTLQLTKINQNQHTLNGKWGLFYEYKGKNIYELSKFVNTKFQTLTYFGIKKSILVNFFSKNILLGIDRIVPIGQALNMDFFWDGYDINKVFSRIVDIK